MTGVRFAHRPVFAVLLICQFSVCFASKTPAPADPNRYLNAVRTFADNVLKYGRDTYGPKRTSLFVDGINVNTHEPVKWITPDGTKRVLSNLTSRQNLLRTLDGLTRITGGPQYRQAAMETVRYALENLRSPNGLLYWGATTAYDVQGDESFGLNTHVLKAFFTGLTRPVTPGGYQKCGRSATVATRFSSPGNQGGVV